MRYYFLCLLFLSLSQITPVQGQQDYLTLSYTTDLTFEQLRAVGQAHFDTVGTQKGMGYKQFKRWEYWAERHQDKNGRVIRNADAVQEFEKFLAKNESVTRAISGNFTDEGPYSAINTDTWSSHLGRITSIDADPNDANHVIAGAPNGGIWKTTNLGITWTPVYEQEANLKIYSVEISHANDQVYFAGTNGSGIRKSTDGGATWSNTTGVTNNDRINTITMHPTDSNILYAIGQFQGKVYKSTDGGDNWTTIFDHSSNMYDLEFKPDNPNIIYVSGIGTIRKSTNAGNSFTTLSGPWVSNESIMLAVTPDDDDYIYALQEVGGGYGGLYLSTNAGTSWTTQSDNACDCNNILTYNQNNSGGQAPRDMDVIVSPTDKTEVHVAGVETWKSTNSGSTFTKTTSWLVNNSLPFIHADVDILIYDGSRIWAGTDGGIFYSDNAANSFNDISQGIGVREFYRIGASETDIDRVSGGSQDNGTGVLKSGIWYDFMGADGMETFIDWSNADIIYGSVQYGSLYKSTNGGNTANGLSEGPGDGAWVAPLEQDPTNSNTLYQGRNQIQKSTNGGSSWSEISDFVEGNAGSELRELAIAPSDNDYIYAAYNSTLYATTNGGTTWTLKTPSLSFSNINYITVHPTNPSRVLMALSGANTVVESLDGGTTWTNLSSNLPNIPAECVLYEADTLDGIYVGMFHSIYYTNNISGGNWSYVGANIPAVSIVEMEIRNDILYACSYGRGLWKIPLSSFVGNYTCADAQTLNTCGTVTTLALDQGNGASQGDANHAVWYEFTSDISGSINISSCASSTNTRLYVHGGSCGNLNMIANSDDDCTLVDGNNPTAAKIENLAVTAGVPIYIEWDNRWSNDAFTFEIEFDLNFTCTNAEILTVAGVYTVPDLATCGGGGSATNSNATNAAWYSFTPSTTGTIDVFSCNGGVDTRLYIYDGSCTNLNQVANSDDNCLMGTGQNNYASEVLGLAVTGGTTYYIEWDDRWSTSGFDFTLNYTGGCPNSYSAANNNMLTGIQGVDADFETDGIIESDQIIGTPAIVDYDSGISIDLFNGFEVEQRATFHAFIDGCGNLVLPDDPTEENDNK